MFCTAPVEASLLGWLGVREAGKDSADTVAAAIDRATKALERLSREFGTDVEGYIADIDRISAARLGEFQQGVAENIDSVGEIASQTIREIARIEQQAFYDARQLIWDAECLIPVFAEQVKEVLGDALNIISDSQAELKIPIIGRAKVVVQKVSIASPDIAYEEIKKGYIDALSQIDDSEPVIRLIAAYGNIARIARKTSCHYRGGVLAEYYLAEVAYFEDLSHPWAQVTGLRSY